MNTIFGTFMEKVIPNLKNAIIKLTIGGNESEMSLEDLKANIVPAPSYKVYTALLTQSGKDDILNISGGNLTIGVTYYIDDSGGGDFTNVGAPNNDFGTYFVATGTTPNSWGTLANLLYNTGAPVVTVLENTIGDIWFSYNGFGSYFIQSYDNTFIPEKTFSLIGTPNDITSVPGVFEIFSTTTLGINDAMQLLSFDMSSTLVDGQLYKTSIEIRVYN